MIKLKKQMIQINRKLKIKINYKMQGQIANFQ